MTDRDEDAFSWQGDEEPAPVRRSRPAVPGAEPPPETVAPAATATTPDAAPALPDGFTAVGRNADTVGRRHPDGTVTPAGEPQPLGNVALVALGIVGGVYALYVVGWIIGGLRLQAPRYNVIPDIMFQGSLWLAVLSPLIWFATTWLLTRHAKLWLRFVWLIAGVVLLVPWPFVMTGAVGA